MLLGTVFLVACLGSCLLCMQYSCLGKGRDKRETLYFVIGKSCFQLLVRVRAIRSCFFFIRCLFRKISGLCLKLGILHGIFMNRYMPTAATNAVIARPFWWPKCELGISIVRHQEPSGLWDPPCPLCCKGILEAVCLSGVNPAVV